MHACRSVGNPKPWTWAAVSLIGSCLDENEGLAGWVAGESCNFFFPTKPAVPTHTHSCTHAHGFRYISHLGILLLGLSLAANPLSPVIPSPCHPVTQPAHPTSNDPCSHAAGSMHAARIAHSPGRARVVCGGADHLQCSQWSVPLATYPS